MKRWISILLLILICYLVQTTGLQSIRIAGVAPSMLIILLTAVCYRYGRLTGLITGFIIGLLVDFMEGSIVGMYSMIYMLIGYFLGVGNKIYYHEDTTIPLLLVAISDFMYNFLIYVIGFLLRSRLHFFFYLRTIILPEILYTVVLAVLLYKPLSKLFEWIEPKQRREEI